MDVKVCWDVCVRMPAIRESHSGNRIIHLREVKRFRPAIYSWHSDDDGVADQRAVWRKKVRHIRGFVRTGHRFVRTVIGVFSACVGLTVVLRFIRTVANIIR